MIRVTQLFRRKPGASTDAFNAYFGKEHAGHVASFAEGLPILRYIQATTIRNAAREQGSSANPDETLERGVMLPPFDGASEYWFATRDDLERTFDPASGFNQALLASEKEFVDMGQSMIWLAYEYPQVNPVPENILASQENPILKFYYPVAPREGADVDSSQRYWRTCHGPIIRALAPVMKALRYVQVHRFEDALARRLSSARGAADAAFMGIAELWFDATQFAVDGAREEAQRIAIADEARFIDFSRSCMWWAKEELVVDHDLFEKMRRRR